MHLFRTVCAVLLPNNDIRDSRISAYSLTNTGVLMLVPKRSAFQAFPMNPVYRGRRVLRERLAIIANEESRRNPTATPPASAKSPKRLSVSRDPCHRRLSRSSVISSSAEATRKRSNCWRQSSPLKILDRFLVLLCRGARLERAKISSFPRFRIFLSRIQPIPARPQFSNHNSSEHRSWGFTCFGRCAPFYCPTMIYVTHVYRHIP